MPRAPKKPAKKPTTKKSQSWKTSKIQRAAMAAIMRENQSRHLQIIEDIKEDIGINPDTPVQFRQTMQGLDLTKLVEVVPEAPEGDAPEPDEAAGADA
ncbi:hypothetical protein LCGC14_0859930 [marine sediment metagenome]|uniref:Uncharacterized protein n=1 Tax=marine sediment metagenome TaxID=412755 RepID=A0A0F9SET8_9ZZZZ